MTAFLSGLAFVNSSHRPWVALNVLPSTNTVNIILIHAKCRVERHFMSRNVLNILWMHRWNISFWFRHRFKQRHWTDYTFPFGIVSKLGSPLPVSIMGMGDDFPFFVFQFSYISVLMEGKLVPFVITVVYTSKYLFNQRWWWWWCLTTVYPLLRRN